MVTNLRSSKKNQESYKTTKQNVFQLWDIRAGRELHKFVEHSGPVTAVEFHPHEFLLTSASTDKTVNFYDLESFSLVSTSDRDTMSIRSVFGSEIHARCSWLTHLIFS